MQTSFAGVFGMELVHRVVDSVSFSFCEAAEIERISMKKITVPHILDNLGLPVPGGLYDPALGPMDRHSRCMTLSIDAPAALSRTTIALVILDTFSWQCQSITPLPLVSCIIYTGTFAPTAASIVQLKSKYLNA
jgi:hypothetical protein